MSFDPIDIPACSRIPSSPFGKLDDVMERLQIDSETKRRLMEQASVHELTLAEFLRFVLRCRAWGVEHVANLHAERIRAIGGTDGASEGVRSGERRTAAY